MDLFSNKTVVGLFDNQEDLGQALSKLHQQGFGEEEDELILVDQDHVAGENPFLQQEKQVVVPPLPTSGDGISAVLDNDIPADDEIPETVLEEKLMDLGIGEKEVGFYARQVKRGNTLVVVETDDEKAQQAYDIMRHFNAKSSVS
ncbi:MAG: hypothetical protein JW953_20845 [Anaerolineae bacterium]|nr:hypothetical protein [Anaerolineae bacterium]